MKHLSLLAVIVLLTCFYAFPMPDNSNPLMEGTLFQGDIAGISQNDVIFCSILFSLWFLIAKF